MFLQRRKNAAVEEPVADDIYHIGTLGTILQLLKLPDGTVKVLIEGLERVKIEKFEDNNEFMEVTASVLPEKRRYEHGGRSFGPGGFVAV